MDDDPIGTRTERWTSAQPYPLASETVRKTYPDGTVRQWTRDRGDQPWREETPR